MHTSRLMKALLVSTCTLLWLVAAHAGSGRILLVVLGAAIVTWAWIRLGTQRHAIGVPPVPVAPRPSVHRHRADRRIERKPRGRLERDLRCPATRAAARARRSTRR